MVVEVWDNDGPRCYLDVSHPLPLYLGRLPNSKCYKPLSELYTAPEESFQLYALVNDEARTMYPIYLKLSPQGVPCHV